MVHQLNGVFVPRRRPQFLVAFAVSIGAFAFGIAIGWSSPALPDLRNSVEFGDLSISELSWIASLLTLGGAFGGPLAGYSINRYGRKTSALLLCFPFSIGWSLIAFAPNVMFIFAGRFLTGICCAALCIILPIYLSEIAEEDIRGIIGSVFQVSISLGFIFILTLGSFVSWRTMAMAAVAIPLLQLAMIYFVPESPAYLLSKGKRQSAIKSLKKLRGAKTIDQIEPELEKMEAACEQSSRLETSAVDYFRPEVLKPLGISLALMIMQQFSGINNVLFYMVDIFQLAGGEINANLSSIIIGVVLLIGMLASAILIDKAGRRTLLIISEIGVAICLLGLGFYFYMNIHYTEVAQNYLPWLPLCSLILYVFLYNIGIGPLPWLLMAELLPSHVKGATSAFVTSFVWLTGFFVTKYFFQVSDVLGIPACYLLFSTMSGLGAGFTYFFVPETKGKSFEEIQKSFM